MLTGVWLQIPGANGNYWSTTDGGPVVADGSQPSPFQLQVRDNRKLTIRFVPDVKDLTNGVYIKGEQNGLFRAIARELEPAVFWEY